METNSKEPDKIFRKQTTSLLYSKALRRDDSVHIQNVSELMTKSKLQKFREINQQTLFDGKFNSKNKTFNEKK